MAAIIQKPFPEAKEKWTANQSATKGISEREYNTLPNSLVFLPYCSTPQLVDLQEKVAENIREQRLLSPQDHALVAVSAGVDSVVLCTILAKLAMTDHWKLRLLHFNHRLRGVESDADAAFVDTLAANLNLPVQHGAGNVAAFADEKGVSIEMAARELRHRFFVDQATATGVNRIILGHHSDDQVELFWLRLLRGSAGLGAMHWSSRSPFSAAVTLVRPLLNVTKLELQAFAEDHWIAFREDSTNALADFERNKLRLHLFPEVEKLRPDFRQSTLRIASVLSAEKDYINSTARKWLTQSDEPFDSLHIAIQREVLRLQLVDLRIEPRFDWIETLRKQPELPVTVSRNLSVRCSDGKVVKDEQIRATFSPSEREIRLEPSGALEWEGLSLRWELVPARGPAAPQVEFFNADRVGQKITVRHWRPGDQFQPIGMPTDVKLQDLFVNAKVPRVDRLLKAVATDAGGTIFWVEGLRISEQFKVANGTRSVLRWEWRRV